MLKNTISIILVTTLLGGCITTRNIVRPDEQRKAIKFETEEARDTFNCTIVMVRKKFPLDNKQINTSGAHFTAFLSYKNEYYLSDAAYFNSLVDKADSNGDAVITKTEANYLYKSYFAHHEYINVEPTDGIIKRLEAGQKKPLCDIH